MKYENLARDMGVELGGWSFGAQFGDLNNDGTLDLYLTNGYISLDRKQELLVRLLQESPAATSSIIGDAKRLARLGWPQPLRLSAEACLAQRWRGQICRRRPGGRRDRHL